MLKAIIVSVSLLASAQLAASTAPVPLEEPPKKDAGNNQPKKGGGDPTPKKGDKDPPPKKGDKDPPSKKSPDGGTDDKK